MSIEDRDIILLTQVGQKYGYIPESAREKIALYSDGKCYVNEYLINEDNDVMNLIELFRNSNEFDELIPESSADIKARYSANNKGALNTSIMQKAIKSLFERCVQTGASDLHIMVRDNEAIVKVRSNGDLDRVEMFTAEKGNSYCRTIYTTMCDVADKNFQPKRAQGARISANHLPDVLSGARVATTPTENGYYMVCRLLYKPKDKNPTLEQLGYESFHIDYLNRLKAKTSGVTIISGPTGSGKSTTLQVVISGLITDADGKTHVITVEDPPEYTIFGWESSSSSHTDSTGQLIEREVRDIDGNLVYNEDGSVKKDSVINKYIKCFATQTPVANVKTAEQKTAAFNSAISAAMRLDPDVIMIGEVRDASSATAALQASMTGHQVFTTIHANNANTIFSRLIDIGAKKELACDADVICGLIAQRLVKKLCNSCSIDIKDYYPEIEKNEKKLETFKRLLVAIGQYKTYEEIANEKSIEKLTANLKSSSNEDLISDLTGVRVLNPKGCPECNHRGIKGRSVVAEIILTDDKYMELVLEEKKAGLKDYWMKNLKGVDMIMHGLLKVKKGISDPFELEKELGYIELYPSIDKQHFVDLLNDCEYKIGVELAKENKNIKDYLVKFPDLANLIENNHDLSDSKRVTAKGKGSKKGTSSKN